MSAETVRHYGAGPYRVAVIHGGPGAPGSASGLARGLCRWCGVLEPLQTRQSVAELVAELARQLDPYAPVTLIGHSWGAWLAVLTAVRFPELVSGLILIGCPPLEERYVLAIERCRRARLHPAERARYLALQRQLATAGTGPECEAALAEFGAWCGRLDSFQPLPAEPEEPVAVSPMDHIRIWAEAAELRRSGALLDTFCRWRGPLTVMHGTWDPHPAPGVTAPLLRRGVAFSFRLLPRCGHTPWCEALARDSLFSLLRRELRGEVATSERA